MGEILGRVYIYSERWRNRTVVGEDTCWCDRKPGEQVIVENRKI
jgi:hypothetical protein